MSEPAPSPVAPQAAVAAPASTLAYFPVSMFGGVMGLIGLSAAWRQAHHHFGAPLWVAQVIGIAAILALFAVATAYAVKAWAGPAIVAAEFNHPVAGNLFGTPMISLLLLPLVMADASLTLARVVWVIGAIGMVGLAWIIVMRWMTVRQNILHVTPAWIVPVVGLLDVPLAVPVLHWDGLRGLLVFSMAVGLFFTFPLFTLIFRRLALDEPLAPAMQPTLMILVAPFAVGFSTYVSITGQVDLFAESLYMLTLFLLAVLLGRLRHLPQCSPFKMGWWGASFPLAASAGTALRYAAHANTPLTDAIAWLLLVLASVTIAAFLVTTLKGVFKGQLSTLA